MARHRCSAARVRAHHRCVHDRGPVFGREHLCKRTGPRVPVRPHSRRRTLHDRCAAGQRRASPTVAPDKRAVRCAPCVPLQCDVHSARQARVAWTRATQQRAEARFRRAHRRWPSHLEHGHERAEPARARQETVEVRRRRLDKRPSEQLNTHRQAPCALAKVPDKSAAVPKIVEAAE
jgi:hypothetical protein